MQFLGLVPIDAVLVALCRCYQLSCIVTSSVSHVPFLDVSTVILIGALANMRTGPRAFDISWPEPLHSIPTPGETGDAPPPSYRASIRNNSSLDITQRLERRLAHYNASQNVVKRWLFEIISVVISAICMGKDCHIYFYSCRKLTIPRCNNRHPCASQQQASSYLASWSNHHHCSHQDCICCTNTTNIRGHWATKMVLVSWQEFTGCNRLRDLR
jgi:hypothetical protein